MKTLKWLSVILVVILFAFGTSGVFAKPQMLKWYLPGGIVDFRGNYPDVVGPLPDISDWQDIDYAWVSDGICWNTGEDKFFVVDNGVFDKLGEPFNYCEGNGPKVAIVPFPYTSRRFYVFSAGYKSLYFADVKINWMNGSVTEGPFSNGRYPVSHGKYFPPAYEGVRALAASASTPNHGQHYLYVTTPKIPGTKEGKIKRYTVKRSPEYDQYADTIVDHVLDDYYDYAAGELELSFDGKKLAGTIRSNGNPHLPSADVVFVVNLDGDGLYESHHIYEVRDMSCPPEYPRYSCWGLEFSPDSKTLFASFAGRQYNEPPKNGIYVIDTEAHTISSEPILESEDYCHSQLELAYNELIYAASLTQDILRGIDLITNQFSTDNATTIEVKVAERPMLFGVGYDYVMIKVLPNQMDGYDYGYWLKSWKFWPVMEKCEAVTVYAVKDPGPGPSPIGTILAWDSNDMKYWSCDVYLGTDYNDVNNASILYDPCGVYKGRVVDTSYAASGLEFQQTYYWRVDAVSDADPNNPLKGEVWAFTTDDCVLPPGNMTTWFAFDENSGTIAGDSGGVINDEGILTNGASFTSTGKVDGGLQLDGVDDYVEVLDSPELDFGTRNFSIDAWVKTSITTGKKVIVDKRGGTMYDFNGYTLYLNNGKLSFQLGDGTGGHSDYNSTMSAADGNNWHHVAATLDRDDPNGLKLYVDGMCQAINPTDRQGSLDNDANLMIGSDRFISGNNFNGSIDEVDLFKRALNANEVQAIFQAGSGGKCKPPQPETTDCKIFDLNDDGIVNFEDFAIFAECWLVNCEL